MEWNKRVRDRDKSLRLGICCFSVVLFLGTMAMAQGGASVSCEKLTPISDTFFFDFLPGTNTKAGYRLSVDDHGKKIGMVPDKNAALQIYQKNAAHCVLRHTLACKSGSRLLDIHQHLPDKPTRPLVDAERGVIYLEEPDGRWAALLTGAILEVDAATGSRRIVLPQVLDSFPDPRGVRWAVLHRIPQKTTENDTRYDDAAFVLSMIHFVSGQAPRVEKIAAGEHFGQCHPEVLPFYFNGKKASEIFYWSANGDTFTYPVDFEGNRGSVNASAGEQTKRKP